MPIVLQASMHGDSVTDQLVEGVLLVTFFLFFLLIRTDSNALAKLPGPLLIAEHNSFVVGSDQLEFSKRGIMYVYKNVFK